MALIFYYAIKSGTTGANVRPQNARVANAASTCRIGGAGVVRAELQLGLEIGAPRRMVPFLSAKSRIAWYHFLMIRFLNARNRL